MTPLPHCLLLKPCWSLRESCQGNSEWNESTVSCQKVEGDLKKQGRRPAEFAGQLLFGSSKYLCPAHSDSSGIVTGAQREDSAFSGKLKQKKSKNSIKKCEEKPLFPLKFLKQINKAEVWETDLFERYQQNMQPKSPAENRHQPC